MSEFLDSIKPLEDELAFDIYAYVNPETREVEAVWAYSLLGISEWSLEDDGWVTVPGDDERIVDTQDYVTYKVDWDNDESFDKKTNESLVVDMFSKGTLNEDYLKENATYVKDENGQKLEKSK